VVPPTDRLESVSDLVGVLTSRVEVMTLKPGCPVAQYVTGFVPCLVPFPLSGAWIVQLVGRFFCSAGCTPLE
jgi:hypothetical protein